MYCVKTNNKKSIFPIINTNILNEQLFLNCLISSVGKIMGYGLFDGNDAGSSLGKVSKIIYIISNKYKIDCKCKNKCVCVPMPIHCTITCFGFHARWIDGIKCGLFSNHPPLGQTTLHMG